ncbi:UDP-N-acetylglucosamine 2-epimerase (non-hydrolyzing) [Candidatus Methanophagaceae archaeon]|nr:UDP-N-acetylglucosamine 2-epimerase (non-hydrolyzing) [Methanophagales archaeon]
MADPCSDYLFAPTEKSKQILLGEGIPTARIVVTGNTVVDAVYQNLSICEGRTNPLHELGLVSGEYFLATAHRQENVDVKTIFESIISGLERVAGAFGLPVIYPIHPRSRMMMDRLGLNSTGILFIDPVDYLSFLQLESKAKLVLTDSGGVQEETCILNVPCVTLRDNTERPETLEVGSNILAGTKTETILAATTEMLGRTVNWSNPFGDGSASEKIIGVLE